jgi:hypothetical protein
MRPLLTAAAALFIVSLAASLDASAQQPAQPSAPAMSEPAAAPMAKAKKKHRRAHARHRRTRYASLSHRMYSPCEIIDGWRAFPTRDPDGYFDTSRVCRRH